MEDCIETDFTVTVNSSPCDEENYTEDPMTISISAQGQLDS